jgi:hypothetical protein
LRPRGTRQRSGQQNQGDEGGRRRQDSETDAHRHSVARQGGERLFVVAALKATLMEGYELQAIIGSVIIVWCVANDDRFPTAADRKRESEPRP